MDIIKKNYKLFFAIVIGAAIGSILTQPAVNSTAHSRYEHNQINISELIGKQDDAAELKNSNKTAAKTIIQGNKKAPSIHKNHEVTRVTSEKHENYRPVASTPSSKKRVTKDSVRIAGALD